MNETKNWSCVFQDVEPPRSSSILRNSSTKTKPIRRVSFSTVLRNATFETKIRRSVKFVMEMLISAAPTLQNLRIGLRMRQSGKSTGLAKQIGKENLKLKDKHKAAFFSLTVKWCLPSPSNIIILDERVCGGYQESSPQREVGGGRVCVRPATAGSR